MPCRQHKWQPRASVHLRADLYGSRAGVALLRPVALQRLAIAVLLGIFCLSLALPRLGMVWHSHTQREKSHAYHELLLLLATHTSQAPHALHHSHQHVPLSGSWLMSAFTASDVHGHYLDDSLPAFMHMAHMLSFLAALACGVSSRPLDAPVRYLFPSKGRAPPGQPLLP